MCAPKAARALGSGICRGLGKATGRPGPRMAQMLFLGGRAIASPSLGGSVAAMAIAYLDSKSCQRLLQSRPVGSRASDNVGSSALKAVWSLGLFWGLQSSSAAEDVGSSKSRPCDSYRYKPSLLLAVS